MSDLVGQCKDCGKDCEVLRDGRCDDCIARAYRMPKRPLVAGFACSAEECRKNGWKVGQLLERAGHPRKWQIKITAIGEKAILFRHMKPREFAKCDEVVSHVLSTGWKAVPDKSLYKKSMCGEKTYDYVPLSYFSAETKKQKKFDAVIDKACELSEWPRRASPENLPFHCMGSSVEYYIHKAEYELGLRKEAPTCAGDNEYG